MAEATEDTTGQTLWGWGELCWGRDGAGLPFQGTMGGEEPQGSVVNLPLSLSAPESLPQGLEVLGARGEGQGSSQSPQEEAGHHGQGREAISALPPLLLLLLHNRKPQKR